MSDEDTKGVAGNALTVLLNDLLTSQRQILQSMVTKDDILNIKRDWQALIANHETRISSLESNRLPKWFWPTLAPVIGAAGTLIGWYLEYSHSISSITSTTTTTGH